MSFKSKLTQLKPRNRQENETIEITIHPGGVNWKNIDFDRQMTGTDSNLKH